MPFSKNADSRSDTSTHRANGVNLGKCGLRISEASGGEVQEIVALVSKSIQVATLVASLVWGVNGNGFVLFHVREPFAQIKPHQIPSYEIPYVYPTASHHPDPFVRLRPAPSQPHHHHVPLPIHRYVHHAALSSSVLLLLLKIEGGRCSIIQIGCCCHSPAFALESPIHRHLLTEGSENPP
ncbi:hypothetical protein CJ030_MR0G005182 [Morella rubra]|uniref:Uncharacterized protein n=1 Tax=Morella rubra TaxID=262757 RepID=A0A6A1ULA4_9ROSI|nr:hypothetical protein CJ030_MR0G005182 [Morella rubra]